MSPITTTMTNARRRALLVARFEERLRELWPDEVPVGRVPFSDFNDLELKATVLGDFFHVVRRLAGERQGN